MLRGPTLMRPLKWIATGAAIAALVSLPAQTASADGYYRHHYGCFVLALPFCIAGAVVGTAAVVATAPLAVAGEILTPRPWPGYYRRPAPYYYYPPPRAYYGPYGGAYAGPPPRAWGPPPGYPYGGPPRGYYGPPPGY